MMDTQKLIEQFNQILVNNPNFDDAIALYAATKIACEPTIQYDSPAKITSKSTSVVMEKEIPKQEITPIIVVEERVKEAANYDGEDDVDCVLAANDYSPKKNSRVVPLILGFGDETEALQLKHEIEMEKKKAKLLKLKKKNKAFKANKGNNSNVITNSAQVHSTTLATQPPSASPVITGSPSNSRTNYIAGQNVGFLQTYNRDDAKTKTREFTRVLMAINSEGKPIMNIFTEAMAQYKQAVTLNSKDSYDYSAGHHVPVCTVVTTINICGFELSGKGTASNKVRARDLSLHDIFGQLTNLVSII
jgi:hypothetical protein